MRLPLPANYSEQSDPYADNWARLPKNYPQMIDHFQRTYYAQSADIDRNVGRIMQALDEQGLAENTILVFTSDHGEMFGAHGRRAKYIFYEEAARIPFLMRWPGHIRNKQISDVLLGTPDIMPTLLSLLDLPVPKSVEGEDLSAFALGKSGSAPQAAHMQGWAQPLRGRTAPSGVRFATTNTRTRFIDAIDGNFSFITGEILINWST